ncbi:hypothetical protein KRX57_08740 [Weeksellaceae bacterium TAE3-ERU29]|nr:hypothetical protein [Weeksellaceae bacterium TAE3-ERU29]
MKKLTLSLGFAFFSLSLFAQQAEIDAANNAFKNNDFKATIEYADQALALLKENPTIEPSAIAQLCYIAGQAAEKRGDMNKASNFYSQLSRAETKPYFETKNRDTGKVEYYLYQSLAEKAVEKGNYSKIKRKNPSANYLNKVLPDLTQKASDALQAASQAFDKKDYETASRKFGETYGLSRALGNENKLYLYYAALAGLQTDKLKKDGVRKLQFLADRDFDGVQTSYTAVSIATGDRVAFRTKKEMDNQVKIGLARDPKVEQSKSLEEELYNYLVYGYYQTEDYEKGVEAAKKALEKFPNNDNINQLLSSMYYKSGNVDEFIGVLQRKVDSGTGTAVDYFNLGKILDDSNGEPEKIREYYEKAIELDPNMTNAYLNLSLFIIKPEMEYVEMMNKNRGSSAKEKKIYNENAAKRKALYQEALPHLEKAYNLEPKNITLIKVLQDTYDILGKDDKFLEMKKKLESLSTN